MPYYYLEVTHGVEMGRRYLLADGATSIGRSRQNTISFSNGEKSVSGHHAIIYKSPERIVVQDIQSTNGTFVNNAPATELELKSNDEIGFGQSGPRLKLILSERELDTSRPANLPLPDGNRVTSVRTREDSAPQLRPSNSTAQEEQGKIARMKRKSDTSSDFFGTSKTAEFQKKLFDKNIDADDMRRLMKKGDRLERVLEQSELGATQTNMLRTVYQANKSMRKQWYFIIAAILVVSVSVSAFFGVRAAQYKKIVTRAKTIKQDLDNVDSRITALRNNPNIDKKELKRLIDQLDEKQKSFSTLKTQINQDDFKEFNSDPLEQRIDAILRRFGETDYHIPQEMVERVAHHIDVYSGNLKRTVGRFFKRKNKYFPRIREIFKEKNIPVELAYVSMLESGLNPMALSHAGARGLWQFMPKTARQFGMRVDSHVDERCDPEKATYGAAEYFKDLIGIFGAKSSVMLCMAAYNAGEGRVMGALRKIDDPMRNRDFWYIYRMGYLAEETNEYIPRVIAFMIISEHPKEYGFEENSIPDSTPLESENDFIEIGSKEE